MEQVKQHRLLLQHLEAAQKLARECATPISQGDPLHEHALHLSKRITSLIQNPRKRKWTEVQAEPQRKSPKLREDDHTQSEAFKAIFHTTELLENILVQLDMVDLARAQLVCQEWRDTVVDSPSLQRNLFRHSTEATERWLYDGGADIDGTMSIRTGHMHDEFSFLALDYPGLAPHVNIEQRNIIFPTTINPALEQHDYIPPEASATWVRLRTDLNWKDDDAPYLDTFFSQPVPSSIQVLSCHCRTPKRASKRQPSSCMCGSDEDLAGDITIGEALKQLSNLYQVNDEDDDLNVVGCIFILHGVQMADGEKRRSVWKHSAEVLAEKESQAAKAAIACEAGKDKDEEVET